MMTGMEMWWNTKLLDELKESQSMDTAPDVPNPKLGDMP